MLSIKQIKFNLQEYKALGKPNFISVLNVS